ncbi:MAG: FAD-dependent oxidoreductase [Campylobacteraceae bacterium]|nr:FAD-dependent oxidoreductase [Campylobacteraceae bacterium]
MEKYDVIIIGGGPAGLVASKLLVAFGKKTAIVERAKLGGDCTHSGCVPSKTLLKSAKAIFDAKNLSKYGLSANEFDIDTSKVMTHVRSVVDEIYAHETPEIFEKAGVNIIEGEATFKSPNEIIVNDKVYHASKFIVATGARASIPNIEGLKTISYLTNENIFLQETIPTSMIIIGTGAIGIEMATAFNRLGTKVTLLSRSTGILKNSDDELTSILLKQLVLEGIEFINKVNFLKVEENDTEKLITIEQNGVQKILSAQELLVASGRAPNVNLGLENAQVTYDVKGIKVDEYLKTSNENIYAIGDVSTQYKFTHIAEQEAIVAASNIGLPINKKMSYEHIGWCVYSDPELAQIGLTPKEADSQYGDEVKTYKLEYKNSDRGYTDVDKVGMIKVSVLNGGRIVGASILGTRAGELIHQLQLAKTFNISFDKLSRMVYLYPTYSDIIKQPAKQFYISKLLNNKALKFLKAAKSFFSGSK